MLIITTGASFHLGKNPHLDFTQLAQKYGDVYSLMLGNRLVVVLNGLNAIEEAIIKHSIAFAGRPQLHTFQLANPKGNSLTLTDYTSRWRLTRKISVSAIHNFAKDRHALGGKLLQESRRLVHCFKQQKGRPVDALTTFKCATANIILDALFEVSRSYEDEGHKRILNLADNFRQAVQSSSHVDFLPLVKYLPNKDLSNLSITVKTVLDVVSQMFVKNKETFDGGQVRNIADSFINVVQKETERKRKRIIDPVRTLHMHGSIAQ